MFVIASSTRGTYAAHISLRGLPAVVAAPTGPPLVPAVGHLELDGLYPNPADAAATLAYRCPPGLTGPGTLRVRDVLGREVWRTAAAARPSGSLLLPTAALAGGLYVCELSWPSLAPVTRKLLVRH